CTGVAPSRAQGAHRIDDVRVVPRTALEPVIARRDGADGTDIHQISRQDRVDALLLKRRDLAAITAIDDVDLGVSVDVTHETDATRAENAAVAVQHQRRTEVDVRLDAFAVKYPPRKIHPAFSGPKGVGEILERALASFVAHGAIERVIDEEELEDARSCRDHLRIARAHHHALGAHHRTRGLQLRHLLDLDNADTTGTVYGDAGVVAVIRHGDAGLDGGLKDRFSFFYCDLPSIDGQCDRVHISRIIS